jgi:phospholipase/carboxylesterase
LLRYHVAMHDPIAIPAPAGIPTHLVVLLHGLGDSAAGIQDIARALSPGLPRAEWLVPDGFQAFDGGGDGRQWFSIGGVTDANRAARVREAATEVSRWIDRELARRGLGGDRLVVVGFSQGAILAAWLAVHRAPRPAAVVMLSGRVAVDQPAAAGASTPVLMTHGSNDAVIPVSVLEPGARALGACGAKVTTRVYPGLGHAVSPGELADVKAFLVAHASE